MLSVTSLSGRAWKSKKIIKNGERTASVCKTKLNTKFSNLETHHIIEQENYIKNNIKDDKKHIKKNSSANLVILCQSCHDKVHENNEKNNDKIIIEGYKQTSKGKKLIVKKNNKSIII